MDLYYNKQKISQIPLVSTTTIGELKQNIENWLIPQSVTKYTIRIFFSDKSELSPEVLNTNSYDHITFESRSHLLNGSVYVQPEVQVVQVVNVLKIRLTITYGIRTRKYDVDLKVGKNDTYKTLINRYSDKSTEKLISSWRIIRAGNSLHWDSIIPDKKHDWVDLVAKIGHWTNRDNETQNPLVVLNKLRWNWVF